uniref:Uncharacterized protein n=1 Tax=Siphoviridae sp. ctZHD14 TaxID=2827891 RepID=A0A8S5SW72_9CAUD|nr:MAG TPA: hypothetical protein [Siphoviridae sp. ctZHD14]
MSRSHKKNPWIKDNQHNKKIFNRRIRRAYKDYDMPSGKYYRKLNDSYDQCDYKIYISEGKCEYIKRIGK